jgi:4-hydroxymandelate oxidase
VTRPALPESVAAYRSAAQARLPAEVWAHLAARAGASRDPDDGDGARAEWQRLAPVPRPLCAVAGGSTRTELFGEALEHPLLLAPVAYLRLFHEAGELEWAMAAAAQGGQAVVSSLATQPLQAITAAAGRPGWFQLYWQGDRQRTARLLERARAAGHRVLVFTVDAPVKLAGLQLPPGVAAVNLEAEPADPEGAVGSEVFDRFMVRAPVWEDLHWLRRNWPGPLLVKGILHPDDARRAVGAGCDGVVVSDHGGRVLAATPSSIRALPAVRRAVGEAALVLLDGGIRSGLDAFRALCCGADAVMVGRPVVWALAVAGGLGVAHLLRLLRDELEQTMALCGARSLTDCGEACLWPV